MAINKYEYEKIIQEHLIERNRLRRNQEVEVLSTYFDSVDDMLLYLDRIPESTYKNPDALAKELARVDIVVAQNNASIYSALVNSMLLVAVLASNHTAELFTIGTGQAIALSGNVLDNTLVKLEMPNQRDINLLKEAGVYQARNFSRVGVGGVLSAGGENRFNRMLELASKIPDRDYQKRVMQSLVNYADSTDPIGLQVRKMGNLYGVEPKVDYKLSESVWGSGKRDEVYNKIFKGVASGKTKTQITEELATQLKQSGVGGSYYKASRTVKTELNNSYLQGTKEYSQYIQDTKGVELLLRREVSPAHSVPDICDNLVGTYTIMSAPDNPHPLCQCRTHPIFAEDNRGEIKK